MLGAHIEEEPVTTRNQIIIAAVLGQLVGLLGYIDPLFIVLVFAGPLVVGALAAARGLGPWPAAALWASAGLNMLWMDWVFAQEDRVFHLVLSVLMALLALAGWGIVRAFTRRRASSAA